MHFHFHFKLGYWQRWGLALVLGTGIAMIVFIINTLPTQAETFECLSGLEVVKNNSIEKCKADIVAAAVKVTQFSYILDKTLKWLVAVLAAYLLAFVYSWIQEGKNQK